MQEEEGNEKNSFSRLLYDSLLPSRTGAEGACSQGCVRGANDGSGVCGLCRANRHDGGPPGPNGCRSRRDSSCERLCADSGNRSHQRLSETGRGGGESKSDSSEGTG